MLQGLTVLVHPGCYKALPQTGVWAEAKTGMEAGDLRQGHWPDGTQVALNSHGEGGRVWQDVASLVELASLLSREAASFPSGGFVCLNQG